VFAGDTSLYCVVEDQTSAAESLNEDLACIHQWSSDWGITLNATNTKSMLFSVVLNNRATPYYATFSALHQRLYFISKLIKA
jgi:hypothetical protein